MVSVEFEGGYPPLRRNTGSEQSRNAMLGGVRAPVFWFGTLKSPGGDPYAGENQSLLDSLLLAQWEDRALKGLLRYDVTSCETKVIDGGKNFVALLNEDWNVNSFAEYEKMIQRSFAEYEKMIQRSGCQKFHYVKTDIEDLLFCIANGDKEGPELVSSSTIPKDGVYIVINANPVEYGHIFMVPCNLYCPPNAVGKKSLELVTWISAEINNFSFHAFYDHLPSNPNKCFQACYFPNPLSVELMPVISFFGEEKGIQIFELADYPIRTLVFSGKKLRSLVDIVWEICSCLEKQDTPFNLLISDCGTKIFLFPQVQVPDCRNLTAWECGGRFIFTEMLDFNEATEEEIMKHLAASSLCDEGFKAVKRLCCDLAGKFTS